MGLFETGGFFDNITDWFGGITGANAQQAAADAQKSVTDESTRRSQKYTGQFDQDYGGSTAEMMKKAQQASQGLAQDQAQYSSMQAAKNAVRAARASGLNRGQAALSAGQSTGDVYGQTYNNALNSGMDRYQRGLSTLSNLATGAQDQALSGTQAGMGNATQMYGQNMNSMGNMAGVFANIFAQPGQATSDERVKEDVKPAFGSLDEALSSIKGFRYKYKDDAPTQNAGKEELGVMAQDLEKVPEFKGAVVDTPEGKKVDSAQLTTTNTALIGELYLRIRELEKELGEKK